MRSQSPCMPTCGRPRRRRRDARRGGITNMSVAGPPMSSALLSPKRVATLPSPRRIARGSSLPRSPSPLHWHTRSETIHLVMDNLNSHRRKSLRRCLRRGNRHRSLGSLYHPLHAHSRELAQPGGDRNRALHTAVSGQSSLPDTQNPARRDQGLEPPHEPRSRQDQLEVQSQGRPAQVRL